MSLFDDMTVFVQAIEAGSFSGAAQRLGIAKSIVSRLNVLQGVPVNKTCIKPLLSIHAADFVSTYPNANRRCKRVSCT
jgi:hypothetical protein